MRIRRLHSLRRGQAYAGDGVCRRLLSSSTHATHSGGSSMHYTVARPDSLLSYLDLCHPGWVCARHGSRPQTRLNEIRATARAHSIRTAAQVRRGV